MERQEFISKLGLGLLVACTGCSLVACGSKGDNPAPNNTNNNNNNGGPLVTANLSSQLTNVGDSLVSNGVILVRIAAGNTVDAFTAVQVACTHQGTFINYHNDQGKFVCPNHGSEFSKTGAVLLGPATTALKKYTLAINGSALTVTA